MKLEKGCFDMQWRPVYDRGTYSTLHRLKGYIVYIFRRFLVCSFVPFSGHVRKNDHMPARVSNPDGTSYLETVAKNCGLYVSTPVHSEGSRQTENSERPAENRLTL